MPYFQSHWIPAFAGMTTKNNPRTPDSRRSERQFFSPPFFFLAELLGRTVFEVNPI